MKVEELDHFRKAQVSGGAISDLPDLTAVKLDTAEPMKKRLLHLSEQLGNPYLFQAAGLAVKVNFTGERKLTEALASVFRAS